MCKIVGIYEDRVKVRCKNDYTFSKPEKISMPGTEAKEIGILKDSELKSLVDFVKQNPEIEFVSLPRVRSADDVISIKQALLF